jgi:hypothetical protein
MGAIAKVLRLLGQAWIALGTLLIIALLMFSWYQHGFRHLLTMVNPSDFRNLITIGVILGPGIALLYLSNAVRQSGRRAVFKGLGAVVVASALFGLLMFLVNTTREESQASKKAEDNRTHEYKASSIRVLNDSATMREHRNYVVTQTSGPVGKEGIPDEIKVGDAVTVKGRTILVRHIFVTEVREDMKWGGKFLAKKGDVTCVLVESEDNLPYGDAQRDRLWIHVEQCRPVPM